MCDHYYGMQINLQVEIFKGTNQLISSEFIFFQKEETDIYLNSKNLGIKTRWKNMQFIIKYLKFVELKKTRTKLYFTIDALHK